MEEATSKLDQISEEFFKQFEALELACLQLQQANETSEIKLQTFKEKHERSLTEHREKERQHSIEEKCLREQVRQLESHKLRIKVECEEKFKSLHQELTRFSAQGKIFQKEAECAKDQLRVKVTEILQIEAKHKQDLEELERKQQEQCYDANDEKLKKKIVDLTQENDQLEGFLNKLQDSLREANLANEDLQGIIDNLNEDIHQLTGENEKLRMEKLKLEAKNEAEEHFPGDQELKIALLEQEVEELSKELKQVKADRDSLEKLISPVKEE